MKKIFVYGILQKDISARNYGIEDEFYLGRGTLYGYKRHSLTRISKSRREDDYVIGDIFDIPDNIEESLYQFESQFGYHREITNPQRIEDTQKFETISYIL